MNIWEEPYDFSQPLTCSKETLVKRIQYLEKELEQAKSQQQVKVEPEVILPSDKKIIKDIREMFDKYYNYVYTTDDGEQRGEWKETFAVSIINYFNQCLKARSK